ncbi:MAG: F510_1955 family glycosylhydrolase, partial [Thermoleophilaceae bacterium]
MTRPRAVAASGCGGGGEPAEPPRLPGGPGIEDPGPIHVHGLGVNPADGALFIATHTGLYRAPDGELAAERVGDRYQDTMGFTVTGPDSFLGSGHP